MYPSVSNSRKSQSLLLQCKSSCHGLLTVHLYIDQLREIIALSGCKSCVLTDITRAKAKIVDK